MRLVAFTALCLVVGCDGVFGLTHVHGHDDAAVIDTPRDGLALDGPMSDAFIADAYVQKTCSELGYGTAVGGSTTRYRSSNAQALTWAAAEADCQDDASAANTVHTHLVVLASDTEASNVYTSVLASNASGGFWVGLSDRITANNFKWVTDEVTGYPAAATGAPWAPAEPSGGAGEDCVLESTTVQMSDTSCFTSHVYACECDANPVNPNNF